MFHCFGAMNMYLINSKYSSLYVSKWDQMSMKPGEVYAIIIEQIGCNFLYKWKEAQRR